MAWSDNLLEASFRGVVFDVVDIEDELGRAVSIAEYPYRDGGETEDLGDKSGHFTINAIIFGDDYEIRAKALLEALDVPGTGELIHPVWGSIAEAQFAGGTVRHSAEQPDACTIRLTFIESSASQPFWDARPATQKADDIVVAGDEATSAADEAAVEAVEGARDSNPLAQLDALRQEMTAPILAAIGQVQSIQLAGLDVLNYPRAWIGDLGAIVDGILGIANFSALASGWAALSSQLEGIFGRASSNAGRMSRGTQATAAQAVNAVIIARAVAVASTRANALAQVLTAEAITPTLSPGEIEVVADDARNQIDTVISDVRLAYDVEAARAIVEPLKDLALAVQSAARAIIVARPPLVMKDVPGRCNFRLLAHWLYGDHTRADELVRLNPDVRNPNELNRGGRVNAYAD